MATTKTELLNNGQVVVTKTSAPFFEWKWTPTNSGVAKLSYKRYEDGVLVYTSPERNVTVQASGGGAVTYDALWTFDKSANPSYTGASIQITYDGGTTFTEIGFVGDELDVAQIESISNNALINKIYDKSGNGNHLEFSTGTRPAIKGMGIPVELRGGKPAMRMNDVNSKLFGPATLTAENGLSLFVVQYNDAITGSNKGIVGKWGGTLGNEYGILGRHFAAPNDVSFISQDSSSVQNSVQSGVGLTTKKLRLFTALYDNATSTKSLRIDGTQVGTANANIRAGDAPFRINGYAPTDMGEVMWISEIRLKKGYISDFAAVESEIISKYGIV